MPQHEVQVCALSLHHQGGERVEVISEGPAEAQFKNFPKDFYSYFRACRILLPSSYPVSHTLVCPREKTKQKKDD